MHHLDALREAYGKPIIITSGYRCPPYNDIISSTGTSGPHTTGMAVDVAVDRQNAYNLLKIAMNSGWTGIGVNQKGDKRFLHLDRLGGDMRPWIWSY